MTTPRNETRVGGCKPLFFVNGERLLQRMAAAELAEPQLAAKAKVAEQTVRNYVNSSATSPWSANSKPFLRVCSALGVVAEDLRLELQEPVVPNADKAVLAQQRFLADGNTVRSIAGRWYATSVDLEIPGVVSYQNPIAWHATVTIEQVGNRWSGSGDDKDGDEVLASGELLEDGNWLRFDYWIDNARLREYGAAMAEFRGDGITIEGILIGRDAGHSNIGLIVAKLTMKRCPESAD